MQASNNTSSFVQYIFTVNLNDAYVNNIDDSVILLEYDIYLLLSLIGLTYFISYSLFFVFSNSS